MLVSNDLSSTTNVVSNDVVQVPIKRGKYCRHEYTISAIACGALILLSTIFLAYSADNLKSNPLHINEVKYLAQLRASCEYAQDGVKKVSDKLAIVTNKIDKSGYNECFEINEKKSDCHMIAYRNLFLFESEAKLIRKLALLQKKTTTVCNEYSLHHESLKKEKLARQQASKVFNRNPVGKKLKQQFRGR